MNVQVDAENRSSLSRITCGWKKPHLPIDWVRRYWRDVHSPAISRRAGLYEYRHSQFGAVRGDVFAPVAGIDFSCPPAEQLMWLSDVRYFDAAGLAAFGESPPSEAKAHLLADIDLLVDKSTTYRSVADDARTLIDETGDAAPAGPVVSPSFALFFRQRGTDDSGFRSAVSALALRWARTQGVRRVRISLFERPDMEAERKAGYPIKTHPVEQQYQAWIDLVLDGDVDPTSLLKADGSQLAAQIQVLHAYPVDNLYTFVVGGKPTLIALRGYPAYEAIQHFDAVGQRQRSLLEWMYGPIAS